MKKYVLILFIALLVVQPTIEAKSYKLKYDDNLKKSVWRGVPDANYVWEGDRLAWERTAKDPNNKDILIKTFKKPIEIIADFKPESKVFGIEGNIERNAVRKFGGALKGFIWLDKVTGGGEVTLPFIAPHIFIAKGDRLNPVLSEISTDTSANNYYEIFEGRTHVYVKAFSGIGGAAGSPPTLIAHYKMNDNAATAVVIDSSGNGHTGEYRLNNIAQNTNTSDELGKINRALDFVGGAGEATGEHIEIADHDDFSPAGTPLSISVWSYMHTAEYFVWASKWQIGANKEWNIFTGMSKKINFCVYDQNATAFIGRTYNTKLDSTGIDYENQWTHFVTTYDGGILSSGIKIYLNGNRVDDIDKESGTFVSVQNLDRGVWIGAYDEHCANGLIDNVIFFSVELSQDEVKRLYNNGHGTEILAEIDSVISPRRSNTSPLGWRARYEW